MIRQTGECSVKLIEIGPDESMQNGCTHVLTATIPIEGHPDPSVDAFTLSTFVAPPYSTDPKATAGLITWFESVAQGEFRAACQQLEAAAADGDQPEQHQQRHGDVGAGEHRGSAHASPDPEQSAIDDEMRRQEDMTW